MMQTPTIETDTEALQPVPAAATAKKKVPKEEKKQEQPIVQVPKQPGRFKKGLIWLLSSHWLLITIPLSLAAAYLGSNPGIITNNLDKPYALAIVPSAVASVIIGWLIINFFKTITTACQSAWTSFQAARKEDGSAQFFWIVIVVFMIVSVFASGSFFNTLEKNAIPGLGYVTALFIDLVAVQTMRARLNAVRMRNKKGASLYLFGVLLCAGASAFANVYTSLADFNQPLTGALPEWMLLVAPWFGLVFPALILLLSMTADYTIDQISSQLNPEQYKAQEAKKTLMMQYQAEALEERAKHEARIDRYSQKKERRVFFLINWLFPVRVAPQQNMPPIDLDNFKKEVMTAIENQTKLVVQRTDFLHNGLEKLDAKSEKSSQVFQSLLDNFSAQYDTDLDLIGAQLSELFSAIDTPKSETDDVQKVDENLAQSAASLPTTGDLGTLPQTDPNLYLVKAKVTQKLSPEELTFEPKPDEKVDQKERSAKAPSSRITTARMSSTRLAKNLYTNSEAARAARCTVSEIEAAIISEDLLLAKNSNKILKSSLDKFIQDRREARVKKTVSA